MTGLAELQARFVRGVTGSPDDVLPLLLDDSRQADRFEIHRNNTFASLKAVLEDAFPTVARIVGPQLFPQLSAAFVRHAPPAENHLLNFGAGLAEFISLSEPLAHLPFLADTARLDWAINAAYDAADAESLAPDDLTDLPPDGLTELKLPLLPSAEMLGSEWPIHAIWMNPDVVTYEGFGKREQCVLVIRPSVDVIAITLDLVEHRFLLELDEGRTLGEAAVIAQAVDPAFDLQSVLANHLASGHFARAAAPAGQGEQQ